MSPEDRRAIAELAVLQHEAIHMSQLGAIGITRRAAEHAVDSGRWQKPFRQTYVTHSGPVLGRTLASAGLLFAGPHSALARRSAASLWGLLPWSEPVHLIRIGALAAPPGLVVHRTRALRPAEVTIRSGLRVTRPLRTLLDLADDLDDIDLAEVLVRAINQRLVSESQLRARLRRTPRDPFTRLLRSYTSLEGNADSGVEVVLANALAGAGVELKLNQKRQMPNRRWRKADLMLEELGLIIQIESRQWHQALANDADIARDREWLAIGFTTCRVSAWRIRHELQLVVTELLEVIGDLRRRASA